MSDFEYAPPADGTPHPETQTISEVAIGGKTFRVPADMAEAIASERQSYQQAPTPVDPEPQSQTPGIPAGDEEEFWANPQAYIQKQIQDGVQNGLQGIQQQQTAQQAEQKFWGDFYQKNPHLKQIDSYVEHLAVKNVNKLKTFNGDQMKIANFLADLGNKELQKFGKTPNTSEVFVEGSAQPTPVANTPPSRPSNVTTMGDILKKRRENRRKARLGA